MSYDQTNRSNL